MNPLLIVLDFQPVFELPLGIAKVLVFRVIDVFLLDGTDKPLNKRVLCRLAHGCHTDLHPLGRQLLNIPTGGILHALVSMVDGGDTLGKRLRSSAQRQLLPQAPPELPSAHRTGKRIQDHRQVDKPGVKP